MKKKTTIIICALALIGVGLVVGGILSYGPQKSPLYEGAYQKCLEVTLDENQELVEKYCGCFVAAPEGILNRGEYNEWLDLYTHNAKAAVERFGGNAALNEKLFSCFLEHGPLSEWLTVWLAWCPGEWKATEEACMCALSETGGDYSAEDLKIFIGLEAGVFPNEMTPEEAAENKEIMGSVIKHCQAKQKEESK